MKREIQLLISEEFAEKIIPENDSVRLGGVDIFLDYVYTANPSLCLYSVGLIYPNECLIRFVLYQLI